MLFDDQYSTLTLQSRMPTATDEQHVLSQQPDLLLVLVPVCVTVENVSDHMGHQAEKRKHCKFWE